MTATVLPEGQRYVRWHATQVHHIMPAVPTPREDGYTRSTDYVGLCGAHRASSAITATLDVLRQVGWDTRVCKRCQKHLSA